jgi:hypothetical protein
MERTRSTSKHRFLVTILAAAIASVATVLALPAGGLALAGAVPGNHAEPSIAGVATVGSTLVATQGSWTQSPTSFSYQWVRCSHSGGSPDGSNCASIGGATTTSYIVATGDVNHRLRIRVTATNADGSRTVASNATAVVANPTAGRPINTAVPTLSGTPSLGQTLRVEPGAWNGRQPITFTFDWLRCDPAGNNCIVQQGFHDDAYAVREGDLGRTLRARANARNSAGTGSRLTVPSAVVTGVQEPGGVITLPNGERSIPVTSIPASERLVVDQVQFSPNPVRSRSEPITVRIKVKDTRGYIVRDAEVFFRSTPLVTRNPQDQRTGQDGWLTLTTVPEADFPQLRSGYAVQFYVKVSRTGDPELGGVSGTRLVQVPLSR